MNSADRTKPKRLTVAVAPSAGHMMRELRMKRRPSRTPPRLSASPTGSSGGIRESIEAETRKENASARSAAGPESSCTSSPPTLGPPRKEKARLPWASELALTGNHEGHQRAIRDREEHNQ